MSKIQVLDQITIDKIAAGEVIERPASVVKELAENAIDAGATAVTVEIKEGGITFMRIADNGIGIDKEDVRAAFLRHSTSKIRSAEDLAHISSLGFRGEALSSIAAVSQVELLTKTKEAEFGVRYKIAGGKEESLEDAGAPDGTTFLIRQLFYNTPARRKFLKTAMTEASHVGDLVTRLALSHPEVSFRFINNGQVKLHTSGNGNLKDVIYHIYGREIASNLIEVDFERKGIHITGYLGKPLISRGNRNFENYFVDGRYIKSSIISKAIEDGYKDFTMQHKYPFVVLYLDVDTEHVDVNVHPTKMDVRFNNQQEIYNTLFAAVDDGLHERELIPEVTLDDIKIPEEPKDCKSNFPEEPKESKMDLPKKSEAEHTEKLRASLQSPQNEDEKLQYFMNEMKKRVYSYHEALHENKQETTPASSNTDACDLQKNVPVPYSYKPQKNIPAPDSYKPQKSVQAQSSYEPQQNMQAQGSQIAEMPNYTARQVPAEKPQQLNFFEEKLLEPQAKAEHKIIGQVFDTYWLIQFEDKLFIIDQHAAHEKVKYERLMKQFYEKSVVSQRLMPAIIVSLTGQEESILHTYEDAFAQLGFEIDAFGGNEYALRSVPVDLYGCSERELFLAVLDELSQETGNRGSFQVIEEKIASMSCKAAVKGNNRLSFQEAEKLIDELLTLDNPYNCPHGRPTIITMTETDLEKKFKRIV